MDQLYANDRARGLRRANAANAQVPAAMAEAQEPPEPPPTYSSRARMNF